MSAVDKTTKDKIAISHPKVRKELEDIVEHINTNLLTGEAKVRITSTLRTWKEQEELYAQGRTKLGIQVTNVDGVKKKSNHQDEADGKKDNLGSAVDLYPFFLGQVQVEHKDTVKNLKLIAAHIKKVAAELKIGITWGGDWKNTYDPPHFELKRK